MAVNMILLTLKINPKFIVTKHQVHFQPMYSSNSNTEGMGVEMYSIDKVPRPFCINSWYGEKFRLRYFTDDLFKIIHQCCLPFWEAEF